MRAAVSLGGGEGNGQLAVGNGGDEEGRGELGEEWGQE